MREEKLNKVKRGRRGESEKTRGREKKRRDKRGVGNDVSVLTDDELFV